MASAMGVLMGRKLAENEHEVCGNPDSGLLVVQAMDARQLERLEDEVRGAARHGRRPAALGRVCGGGLERCAFSIGPRRLCSAGTALSGRAGRNGGAMFKTR